MNKRNFIITDIETTGLDPADGAEIVQIAAKAFNYWDLEPHTAGAFNVYLKPQNPDLASAKALEVIGPVWDEAKDNGLDPKIGLQSYVDWCDGINDGKGFMTKPMLVGHNATAFDVPFIQYWLKQYNIVKKNARGFYDYPWYHNTYCTIQSSFMIFEQDPNVNNFSLDAMLEVFGEKRDDDYHDALADVNKNSIIFLRTTKFMREVYKRIRIKQ